MARVQCFDCDMPVVVDPHGRCPEGHDLGPVGERIEQSLGRAEPHPDEPQPWVAVLDADEVAQDEESLTPRAPRPISVGPEPSEAELNSGTADGLLRELHALHGTEDSRPAEHARGLSSAAPTADGNATTGHDLPPAATTSDTPDSPPASGPWDDWDDWEEWNSWTGEEGSDTPTQQDADDTDGAPESDGTGSTPIPQDADGPWNPATEQGELAEDDGATTADTDPTPAPRRAPTVRSEESLSAMAELAALLGDDGPAPAPASPGTPEPRSTTPSPSSPRPAPQQPPASQPPAPQPPAAAETPDASTAPDTSGDHLATVSQLPVRPQPSETDQAPPPPPPAPPPSTPDDETPADETPADKGDRAAGGGSLDWSNFTAKGKKSRFGR